MIKLDPFSIRRLEKFVSDLRSQSGQLPTLKDFASAGFSEEIIDRAVRDGILESLYVTLTNGTVVKGYKVKTPI